MERWANRPVAAWAVAACALAFAAAGAKPFASAWNDGSRLASVESLVERGTFRIDHTTFLAPEGTPAYDPDNALLARGTLDKLLIDGHWYSDKPPLVSVPLAGAYRGLMAFGLPKPSERPDVFAWVITVLLSGTGYAVAVGCMWALGTRVGLSPAWRLAWLAAFALATVLPAYTRSANNHIAQLGAVAAVCVLLCRIADRATEGRVAWGSLLAAAFIAGFAYNLDFGIGPPFAFAVLAGVAFRTRRLTAVAACGVAALPLIIAGHAINYSIGGDFVKPLNMHSEYLAWPGSPFETTMTGIVRPRPVAQFLYALDLLFGKKGFLTHNPPLLLAVVAGVLVLKRGGVSSFPRPGFAGRGQGEGRLESHEDPSPQPSPRKAGARATNRLELLALCAWCVCGWLMYGVLSKNHGGACVSVRWFVPFLVPGFWLLAKLLAERPELRRDFLALSAWGLVLSASAWWVGPWWMRVVPGYWWVFGGSFLTWAAVRTFAPRAKGESQAVPVKRAA